MEFVLYGRFDCHPCKMMLHELNQLNVTYSFSLKTVDISDHPDLTEKYGARIPVLLANGSEICHFTLDRELVLSYLAKEGSGNTASNKSC